MGKLTSYTLRLQLVKLSSLRFVTRRRNGPLTVLLLCPRTVSPLYTTLTLLTQALCFN